MIRIIPLLAILAVSTAAVADDFTLAPVTVAIPAGFAGPVRQEQNGATSVGFTKSGGSGAKTLLQISLYDTGHQIPQASDTERSSAASKCLLEFIGGVERRRSNFKRTEISLLRIEGVPAAKLQWTGRLQEMDTVGVMYCFVVGTKIISFHTQDIGSAPTTAMSEAIQAFERAKVAYGR